MIAKIAFVSFTHSIT